MDVTFYTFDCDIYEIYELIISLFIIKDFMHISSEVYIDIPF